MKPFARKRLLILILCSVSIFAGTLAASRRLIYRGPAGANAAGVQTAKIAHPNSGAAPASEKNLRSDDRVTPADSGVAIDHSVIAGGGGTSNGSNAGKTFEIYGTIGQLVNADSGTPGQNTQSGGQFKIEAGYLNTLPVNAGTIATVPTFQFDADFYSVSEGVNAVNVRVLRLGPADTTAAVEIISSDASARQKGDYEMVANQLVFAPNETVKTLQVLVNDDAYSEGTEFATLLLQHPQNGVLGAPSTATLQINDNAPESPSNPIDDARKFAGTHYHDFLARQSDQAGEDFWTQQIEACGVDAQCLAVKRVTVSTAFFLSIEFQQTGYLVMRSYKTAFGNTKTTPRYATFLADQREVDAGVTVGAAGWEQKLVNNRQAYLNDFVSRSEFVTQFPQGQSAPNYVDKLFLNADVTPSTAERDAAIAAYGSGNLAGRAAAFSTVVESASVFNRLYNDSFVLMQFYGYLRRNPDDEPDLNFTGYDFWLAKMNQFSLPGEDMRDATQALGRIQKSEMVRAFIESLEYRQRFGGAFVNNQLGPPVSAQSRQ